MLSRSRKDLVGIDIGSSAVKLVQLREVKGGYALQNLGIAKLPPEAIVDNAIMDSTSVVEGIRSLVESHKIKTKNVATSVAGHSVIIRKIQLPIMTEEEMEASIQWEAEQYIPFEIGEVFLDFQILGPDEKDPSQMNVILVAAKRDFVNDYLAVVRESGLTPTVVDVDAFALENAFEANYLEDGETIFGLINMGASAMNVNILKDGVSIFTRDIQVGGNLFNEDLQKRLNLSGTEAEIVKLGGAAGGVAHSEVTAICADAAANLAQEVQRSLDFFAATSADEKVQKLFVTGGASLHAAVVTALKERLDLPVELFNPFREITVDEKHFDPEYIEAVGPLMTVAVGLAMRRLGDK